MGLTGLIVDLTGLNRVFWELNGIIIGFYGIIGFDGIISGFHGILVSSTVGITEFFVGFYVIICGFPK